MMDVSPRDHLYESAIANLRYSGPGGFGFPELLVYEEFFHGHALRRFLEAVGIQFDSERIDRIRRSRVAS